MNCQLGGPAGRPPPVPGAWHPGAWDIDQSRILAEVVCGIAQAAVPAAQRLSRWEDYSGLRSGLLRGSDQAPLCPTVVFLIDKAGIVRGFWGQRPVNPDEIWAPDPLFSSEPILELAQEIVQRP
jgi:hypothetical protein